MFHHPDFLAYHGARFDEHHLGILKGETLIGIMPLAVLVDAGRVTGASPYGASYGGLMSPAMLHYSLSAAIVRSVLDYLCNIDVARITVIPSIAAYYASGYSDTLLFAMLEQGFEITGSDITSLVPLASPLQHEVLTSRARNAARRAERSGIVCRLRAELDDFWPLMVLTFSKHGSEPTHSYGEWKWLMENLPDQVWVDVAYAGEKPVAGIGHLKISQTTDSSFYLCSDPAYSDTQALSLLIYRALMAAQQEGLSWFDFGTSSSQMVARENIFRFKEGFGAIGMFRHSMAADL